MVVAVDGGAWTATPTALPGVSSVRFYLSFPESSRRNDVTLPAGRVFFSSSCFEGADALDAMGVQPSEVIDGPGGVGLLRQGGLTIKRNDASNLFGLLGDVMLILGRFSVSPREQQQPASVPAQETGAN